MPPDPASPGGPANLGYPNSLMGIVAHLRQAMLDAEHDRALRAYDARKGGLRLPYDPALESGFAYDDPDVGIEWPAGTELAASARDSSAPRLAEIADSLPFTYRA